jgi:hypothetical protein
MKKIIVLVFIITACMAFMSFLNPRNVNVEMSYPEGYRGWTHVKSSIVGPGSPAAPKYEGFTHIYANEKAMEGYTSGVFADGAVIVFDVLESATTKGGMKEGERKFIDVMMKDSKLYAATGGWGFEEFDKSSKTIRNLKDADKTQCYNCHVSRKENGYVFSSYRE